MFCFFLHTSSGSILSECLQFMSIKEILQQILFLPVAWSPFRGFVGVVLLFFNGKHTHFVSVAYWWIIISKSPRFFFRCMTTFIIKRIWNKRNHSKLEAERTTVEGKVICVFMIFFLLLNWRQHCACFCEYN